MTCSPRAFQSPLFHQDMLVDDHPGRIWRGDSGQPVMDEYFVKRCQHVDTRGAIDGGRRLAGQAGVDLQHLEHSVMVDHFHVHDPVQIDQAGNLGRQGLKFR